MEFPKLKTGAVLQYGAARQVRYATRVLRFLDGGEQRFSRQGRGERRWVVRLSRLDEGELALVENFFLAMQGQAQEFTFKDPLTGEVYEQCRLGAEELSLRQVGIHAGEAVVEIVEVIV